MFLDFGADGNEELFHLFDAMLHVLWIDLHPDERLGRGVGLAHRGDLAHGVAAYRHDGGDVAEDANAQALERQAYGREQEQLVGHAGGENGAGVTGIEIVEKALTA